MSHELVLDVTESVCAEAVEEYAAQLSRQSAIRLSVTAVQTDADFEFADGASPHASLCIAWSSAQPAEAAELAEWERPATGIEDEFDDCDRSRQMVHHYSRMLKVLARNPEAARALLRRNRT